MELRGGLGLLEGLYWTRPAGFLAGLLPLLVLLLSLRPERPRSHFVGTFGLWLELSLVAPRSGHRRRWRLPIERALAVAALVAGVLALAGPRIAGATERRPWRLWVDRSPSMYLPHTDADGEVSGRGTRLEVAAAAALDWLRRGDPDARVEWCLIEDGRQRVVLSPDLPAEWRAAPLDPAPALRFAAHDDVGALWITDHAPPRPPERAGCFASGGGFVPGPIAEEAGRLLDWDGRQVEPRETRSRPRRLSTLGQLPGPILDFARLWCADRGVAFEPGQARADASLLLASGGVGPPFEFAVGRDGWTLAGRSVAVEEGRPWLSAPSEAGARTIVGTRPGRIDLGLLADPVPTLGGDPAAFAVSWAELFDTTRRIDPQVVALPERAAAGAAFVHPPSARPPLEETPRSHPLASQLALAATLLALAGGLVAIGRA